MKTILIILSLLVYSSAVGQNLNQFLWKNRLLILVGNTNSKGLVKQKNLFEKNKETLNERDILVFEATEQLKNQLNIDNSFQGVLLLGKDGTIKLKKNFVVSIEEIIVLIDGMPMRKAELSRNKG